MLNYMNEYLLKIRGSTVSLYDMPVCSNLCVTQPSKEISRDSEYSHDSNIHSR